MRPSLVYQKSGPSDEQAIGHRGEKVPFRGCLVPAHGSQDTQNTRHQVYLGRSSTYHGYLEYMMLHGCTAILLIRSGVMDRPYHRGQKSCFEDATVLVL